jgi:hypothetical protein
MFLRLKVRKIGEGLHPNDVVVEVETVKGTERLVVDRRAIEANSVSIGMPLRQDKGRILVELPRETMTGAWRVWVRQDALKTIKTAA